MKWFQKKLKRIEEDRPFRGPSEFHAGEWIYGDESNGKVDDFRGVERIFYRDQKVYELHYHGGIVK